MPSTFRRPLALDLERPLAVLAPEPGSVVLRRAENARLGWPVTGNVLLFDPVWTASLRDGRWECAGPVPTDLIEGADALAFASGLAARLRASRNADADVPAIAGWIGYEAGAARLGARHPVPAPGSPPDAWFAAYDTAVVASSDRTELVVSRHPAIGVGPRDPRARAERATERLAQAASAARDDHELDPSATIEPFDREWHRRAVLAVHEHLRAGSSYQINLTGFVRVSTRRSPWSAFSTECAVNPVGYAAHLCTGTHTITSHSPELLLRLRADHALTAPIKGTIEAAPGAPSGLRASAKDRAEHVMIVDLCRNDLGRAAHPGTVRVDALMRTLGLRGLVHLVSEVSARVRADAVEHLLADLFPGGSVTGAPKRSSCVIIRSLEPSGRGPYTGSIGVIDGRGDADWNIAIRTALWHDGAAWFGCGGGIVLDSDPDREFEEAMLKARSFLASARGRTAPTVL